MSKTALVHVEKSVLMKLYQSCIEKVSRKFSDVIGYEIIWGGGGEGVIKIYNKSI